MASVSLWFAVTGGCRRACRAVVATIAASPPLLLINVSPPHNSALLSPLQAARECNDALLELRPSEEAGAGGAGGGGRVDTAAVLAVVGREVGRGGGGGGDDDGGGGGGAARIEALRWIEFLLAR